MSSMSPESQEACKFTENKTPHSLSSCDSSKFILHKNVNRTTETRSLLIDKLLELQ